LDRGNIHEKNGGVVTVAPMSRVRREASMLGGR
jgi:hypothetical protein